MNVTITGTGFRNGVVANLTNGSTIVNGDIQNRIPTQLVCSFPITSVLAGSYDLTILNLDGTTVSKPNAFAVKAPALSPVIASFSPMTGENTASCALTILGSAFQKGAIVTLRNGSTVLTATAPVITATQIKCNLPLTGARIGEYNVTVLNPDGISNTSSINFTVKNPTPTIGAVTPSFGYNNSAFTNVTITGTKFVAGLQVDLLNGSITLPGVVNSSILTATKCVVTFELPTLPAGNYNVKVTNPGGPNVTKPNGFLVKAPSTDPTINGIKPISGVNNASLSLTVNGSHFRAGATIIIANGSLIKTVPGVMSNNEATLKGTLPLKDLPIGEYSVIVTNSDGSSAESPQNLTVLNPIPGITTITPNSAFNTSAVTVTVSGSIFVNGLNAVLINGSTTISGTPTVISNTKFTATFDLSSNPSGIYDLKVANPGDRNYTKSKMFTVRDPSTAPVINGLSPTFGVNNAPLAITITGSYFRVGATITITNGSTTKTVAGAMSNGGSTLKGTLPLKDLPIGQYTLIVTNSDGSRNTSPVDLKVQNPNPTITTFSPNSGFNTSSIAITISGTNFVDNLTTTLTNGSTTVVGTVTNRTATKFIGTFRLKDVEAGLYTLNVSNPETPNATKTYFNLKAPLTAPTFTKIEPANGTNSAAFPVTITGTYFRIGATVTITNGSMLKTVNGVISNNSNTLKCTLPLTGLPIGLYDLTIKNTDGSLVNTTAAFQVNNTAPTVTRITPSSVYNTSTATVTIGGTKFVNGASIVLNNGTLSVPGSVVSLSSTSITGTFPLNGATAAVYDVMVSNPGNANGTKVKAFTVLKPGNAAVISTVNPASGFNNANLPVTITGLNFKTPVVYLNQGSLTKIAQATAGKSSTSTSLFVTLPLNGVPGGMYNITVRNNDGVNTTAQDILYVTDYAMMKPKQNVVRSSVVQRAQAPNVGTVLSTTGVNSMNRPMSGGGVIVQGGMR